MSLKMAKNPILAPTLINKLGVLFISLIIMIWITGVFQYILGYVGLGTRNAFLISSTFQSCFAFIFPSWLAARLCYGDVSEYVGISCKTSGRQYIGVLVLYILLFPFINSIVDWNAGLHLPEAASGLEEVIRSMEDQAARITEMILADTSVWGLISGILIIGCLTGFSEEMFFRGGLQRAIVTSGVNKHLAVWISAFIFSAVHFQFFGFVPRMLLGALFGYLYLYTGSIWISAFAHALNNSVVVMSSWLANRGIIGFDLDSIGVAEQGFPVAATISVILSVLFIITVGKKIFKPANNGTAERS